MAADPIVRDANLIDLPRLMEIEQACFDSPVAFNRRRIRNLLLNPRVITRVAHEGTIILGWSIGLIRQRGIRASGRIYNVGVDPAMRGRGVGRILVIDMIEQLSMRRVDRIYLEVEAGNEPAVRLYEKTGFTIRRQLEDYYAPGRPGLSMCLLLDARTEDD
ncbi:MAG: GNAT family N-acetyltransferase [Phycisphaeraceae bacterium]|nr:GNAT family N-acetyltransferase [Phycisphaeraceae bacterium]